ncbi:MAG: response regulator [Desulfobacteraceae bacterium]|nr:response regulator [Desulfobacteraceae bacterium]
MQKKMMAPQSIILIADRNPRIREFIQRELKAQSHQVIMVENAEQLGELMERAGRVDVLVIDPDMPGLNGATHLNRVLLRRPTLPVIFHCLASDYCTLATPEREVVFVEKSGQSVDALKQQIWFLLMRRQSPDQGAVV